MAVGFPGHCFQLPFRPLSMFGVAFHIPKSGLSVVPPFTSQAKGSSLFAKINHLPGKDWTLGGANRLRAKDLLAFELALWGPRCGGPPDPAASPALAWRLVVNC